MNLFYNSEESRLRSGWRLILQFLLLFACTAFFLFPLMWLQADPSPFSLLNTLSVFLGAVSSVWIAGRWLDRRSFLDFGQHPEPRLFQECGWGLLLGLAVMALIFGIEYLAGWISLSGFGWERASDNSWIWTFVSFLLTMIMVGYYEELVFRGYQIVNLSEGLHLEHLRPVHAAAGAVLLSSVLFGVMHAWNANATFISTANIVAAGAVLAVPYVVSGRLGYSVGLHISWNFAQAGIFGFPVSGTPFRESLLQIEQEGPDWITGGAFGPEGGLLGLLGLGLILLLFFFLLRIFGRQFRLAPLFNDRGSESVKADERGS